MYGPQFEHLVHLLRQLPGVGKKQSEKIAFYILNLETTQLNQMLEVMRNLNVNFNRCSYCKNITQNPVCIICLDPKRNKKLMIVESVAELNKFEDIEVFEGKYFILEKDLATLIKNELNKEAFSELAEYAQKFPEIILALSPTFEGEIISNFLTKILKNSKNQITKLANGIPVGAQVEYIDPFTLKQALINRKKQ